MDGLTKILELVLCACPANLFLVDVAVLLSYATPSQDFCGCVLVEGKSVDPKWIQTEQLTERQENDSKSIVPATF